MNARPIVKTARPRATIVGRCENCRDHTTLELFEEIYTCPQCLPHVKVPHSAWGFAAACLALAARRAR